ncbi:MAG: scyllo-inositol 2-dehydrogenase [Acidimicrobiaceae bacterium]
MGAADPVRVALVGYGLAGETFHAPLIGATEGIELAAVVTSDADRRRRAGRAHPAAERLGDVASLWTSASHLGIELVVVAAPNRAHVPLAMDALGAGLSVVVDKPFAATAADARRVAAEAERRGLVLSVFHNRRWDGDFLTVQRLVDAGTLGEVWRFESRYERWRPRRQVEAWRERADPADAGGLLFDLGSHLIDQAVLLFGPPRTVYAELERRRTGAEVDDDVFVALDHRGGVRSHLWASSVASRPAPRFRVLGSRQGYEVWGMDPQEEALKNGERPDRPGVPWGVVPRPRWGTVGAGDDVEAVPTEPGDYRHFYRGMVAALRGGAPPPVTAGQAVVTMDVIEAARRSAAAGAAVQLT